MPMDFSGLDDVVSFSAGYSTGNGSIESVASSQASFMFMEDSDVDIEISKDPSNDVDLWVVSKRVTEFRYSWNDGSSSLDGVPFHESDVPPEPDDFFEPRLQGQHIVQPISPLATIQDLSDDALSIVFEHIAATEYRGFTSRPGSYSYNWISVFKVCKRWKSVGLQTPRAFRYIDLQYLPIDIVYTWVERSGAVKTYVWLPDPLESIVGLSIALRARSDLLSTAIHVYIERDLVDSGVCAWEHFLGVGSIYIDNSHTDMLAGHPHLPTFHNLHHILIDGTLPAELWVAGMFPETVRTLTIRLLPLPEDAPPLTDQHIRSALHGLPVLDSLVVSVEHLLSSQGTENHNYHQPPLVLPSIQCLTFRVTESDYPTVLSLIPAYEGIPYDLMFRPYSLSTIEERDTQIMVESLVSLLVGRIGTFREVRFDLTTRSTFMVLYDVAGHSVCLQVVDRFGKFYGQVLDAVDATALRRCSVKEDSLDEIRPSDLRRSAGLRSAVRKLTGLTDLYLEGDVGVFGRDLLISLADREDHRFFRIHQFRHLEWPRLCSIYLHSIQRDWIWGIRGTVEEFVCVVLRAINTPNIRIDSVRVAQSYFNRDRVASWSKYIPVVLLEGSDGGRDEVFGSNDKGASAEGLSPVRS